MQRDERDNIPAPTHVDGTGGLQTVSRSANPRYWQLINEFGKLTGVPVVLNTSFNDNEPIVCRPEEAFLSPARLPVPRRVNSIIRVSCSRLWLEQVSEYPSLHLSRY